MQSELFLKSRGPTNSLSFIPISFKRGYFDFNLRPQWQLKLLLLFQLRQVRIDLSFKCFNEFVVQILTFFSFFRLGQINFRI